jgi:VWFA-related protein
MKNLRLPILVALLVAGGLQASGSAQQVNSAQQAQPATPQPTFRSTTRLIVQTVMVKDKDGNPIRGLTEKDFVVTEDGKPQQIAFVEYQELAGSAADSLQAADTAGDPAAPAVQPVAAAPPPSATGVVAQTQLAASSTPGDIKYKDRRLVVLYFDPSALGAPPDQLRAYLSARTYVEKQMGPADLISILWFYRGSVRILQDFTDNREQLLAKINVLIYGDDQNEDGISDNGFDGTAFGQEDGEFGLFTTDRQLSALQNAMSLLKPLPEQKALIFFAGGLRLSGTDNQAQMKATINAAIRSNTIIHTIDARGLVAMAPMGDANQASAGGMGAFTGRSAGMAMSRFQQSQDSLYALAKDTGGKAMFDYNDLTLGIRQAAESISSYYIIGYYSENTTKDGKFRRVKMDLTDKGRQLELSYRQGYYAEKEFQRFTQADKERQLEEALMLEDPLTEMTIAMEVNYFMLNSAEYFIPISLKIPGSELALSKRGGKQATLIDFIGIVKDDYNVTWQNFRDKLDIRLSEQTAAELARRPIEYQAGFTLLPGKYHLKMLARDAETGRIGTYQTTFTVPNLDKEVKKLAISTVVLSGRREPVSSAIYSVKQKVDASLVDPLVFDGQKLVPSVTRVFSKARDLHVLLQAYQRRATTMAPVVAFVSFYQDGHKVMETKPIAVVEGMDPRSKAIPIRFSIPLTGLETGQYDVQVSVLEPTGQKVAFWSAPISVVQ